MLLEKSLSVSTGSPSKILDQYRVLNSENAVLLFLWWKSLLIRPKWQFWAAECSIASQLSCKPALYCSSITKLWNQVKKIQTWHFFHLLLIHSSLSKEKLTNAILGFIFIEAEKTERNLKEVFFLHSERLNLQQLCFKPGIPPPLLQLQMKATPRWRP